MNDLERLASACSLAADAHAGQRRKGPGDVPYIGHPLAVAKLTASAGGDVNAVIAAVLHDVVEDTPVTLLEILESFGPEVADTVEALTSPAEWDSLPLAEKKARQAEHVRGCSPRARLVKLADQTSNLRDLAKGGTGWTAERNRAYLAGARAIATECAGVSAWLDLAFAEAAARLETGLEAAG